MNKTSIEQQAAEIERLRKALHLIATCKVDGNGRDYYWEGRAIAQKALNGFELKNQAYER